MRRSPQKLRIAWNDAGLTHFGGVHLFHEFLRVLHFRDFLTQQIRYPRRNREYSVSQMLLALVYPIVLGLDRIETASLLRRNGTFQYLTGLQSFPDPQTLRRFLLHAPAHVREQLHRANDRLLQRFIHLPEHRSRLLFDLDSTVVTSFGHQEGAEDGYNPRSSGMSNCDAAMREPGRAARNSWPAVSSPVLPTFASSACGPMPVSVTGRFWRCWKCVQRPNTLWFRA